MAKPTLVDDGALCRCGSRTIEGDCFGCGKPPRTCDCPRGDTLEAASMRTCIGSTKFGIEAHQAPPADFPVQPSQKDGLGRMCKPHWNQYTNALRKAAIARKVEAATTDATETTVEPKAEVAKERAPRAPRPPKPESPKVRAAKERVAATEKLAGKVYTDAVGSDDVQAALEVINGGQPDATIAADVEATAT